MFKNLPIKLGAVILTAIAILAISISLSTYLWPGPRFLRTDQDIYWIAGFAGLILACTLLVWFSRGRTLLILCAAGIFTLLTIPIIFSQSSSALLATIWISIISILLGDWFISNLLKLDDLPTGEHLVLCLTSGVMLIMILTTILSFAHLLYQALIWGLAVFLSVCGILQAIYLWRKWLKPLTHRLLKAWNTDDLRPATWVLAILLVSGLGGFIWAVAPAIRYDAASYHIAVPFRYIANHGMVDVSETLQGYFAHYVEMFYTFGLSLVPASALPNLLSYLAGVACTGLTFFIGRRVGGTRTGLFAAALFGCLPIVLKEVGTAYNDIFICLFINAAILMLLRWNDQPKRVNLVLAGLFCGIAAGSKLSALTFLCPILIFILLFSFKNFRFSRKFAIELLLFCGIILVLIAPWLIRDFIWTGNPIFPFLNNLFKSSVWFDRSKSSAWSEANMMASSSPGKTEFAPFYWLPVDLVLNSPKYYHEADGGMLAALPLLALPWLYSWSPILPKKQRQRALWLFVLISIGSVILFQLTPNARYLFPAYPLFAVLAALNIETVWQSFSQRKYSLALIIFSVSIAALYFLSGQLVLIVGNWGYAQRYPVRYFLGRETADQFITPVMPVYQAFQFLNQQGNGIHKVLSIGNELRLYTQSHIYGPLSSREAFDTLHNPQTEDEFASLLKQNGYEYILIYTPEQNFRPYFYQAPVLSRVFFSRYTRLVYTAQETNIYQLFLNGQVPPPNLKDNLLVNPGFEELSSQGKPIGWTLPGAPTVIHAPDQIHSGQAALEITGPSISAATQDVPVEPGTIYTAGYWAKPEKTGEVLQAFWEWLDVDKQVIGKSAEWKNLQDGWNWYQLSDTAPLGAAYARFIASTATSGATLVDDLCFVAGGNCP